MTATVPTDRTPRYLPWAQWWNGALLAILILSVAALLTAEIMPRGPVTATHAISLMAILLIAGLGTGLATGSRWSVLGAPLVFATIFEITRLGLVGPTVEAPRLTSLYGIIAFVLGRGLGIVFMLLPLLLGALIGIDLASRLGHPTARRLSRGGWIGITIGIIALIAQGLFIARPASTAPIPGPDGAPLAGSVSELVTIPIGGHDQSLMVRGRDAEGPVLLFLAGGPGGTELGAMRQDAALEQDFVVVTWDQRGSGRSYAALDPTATLTLGGMVSDTIEVTDYLRDRFDEERIYLVGQSWGFDARRTGRPRAA